VPVERLARTSVQFVSDGRELVRIGTAGSMLVAEYWRKGPLVFSLLPPCQGDAGSHT
jgi:hypothetical protein